MADTLSICSWNINSVRARIDIVEQLLRQEAPDILCLQETKVVNETFPTDMFRRLGYVHQVLNGQRMHHGVAIMSKVPVHEDDRLDWQANGEARHVGVEISCPGGGKARLNNVYVPAGGEVPDRDLNPKFGQKLDFLERMTQWSKGLNGRNIILGDFNIAPLESDVWSHKQLIKTVSHTQIEIDRLDALQAAHDWVDIGRKFHPAPKRLYTWWSYRARDWAESDRGRRLDHIWVSPDIADGVKNHNVFEPVRSWTKPSDHAPLMSEFVF